MVHKGTPSVAAGQVADVDGVPLVRANRGAGETSMAAVLLAKGARTGDSGVLEPHIFLVIGVKSEAEYGAAATSARGTEPYRENSGCQYSQ